MGEAKIKQVMFTELVFRSSSDRYIEVRKCGCFVYARRVNFRSHTISCSVGITRAGVVSKCDHKGQHLFWGEVRILTQEEVRALWEEWKARAANTEMQAFAGV